MISTLADIKLKPNVDPFKTIVFFFFCCFFFFFFFFFVIRVFKIKSCIDFLNPLLRFLDVWFISISGMLQKYILGIPERVASTWQCYLSSESESEMFTGDTSERHSPGPWPGRLVPSSHQRSELSNTILCIFSRGDKRVWKCIPIPNGLGQRPNGRQQYSKQIQSDKMSQSCT